MSDLKHGLLASCAAFGLLVGSAAAEDYAPFDKAGFYAAVFGGVNILQDADVSVDPMGSTQILSSSGDIEYDTGFVLGAAVGHEFSHNIRGELELSYRRNDVSSYYEGTPESGGAINQAGSDDHVAALAVMANVWRDVDLNETFGMHFGGGVGVAQLHVELDDIDSTFADVGRVDDSDWVLAGQAGVGFSMMLPQGWIATVDYRAFLTADGTFEGRDVNGDAFEIEHDYLAHSIMVGLRMPFSGY